MSRSGRSSRTGRSSASSPVGSCSDDDASSLSRFKVNEKIKKDHAERHAIRHGKKENVPHYMTQTVSALQKRQSFRVTKRHRHPIQSRRTQSLDIQRDSSELDQDLLYLHESNALSMIRSEGSASGDSLEEFVLPEEEEEEGRQEADRYGMRLGLETTRDEVERTFRDFDAAHPSRTTNATKRYVEGGVSPLPSRASDLLSDDEIACLGEPRSRSATGLAPLAKTAEREEEEALRRDVLPIYGTTGAARVPAELPPSSTFQALDVEMTTRDEMRRGDVGAERPLEVPEIEPAPQNELQSHPRTWERTESLDSTAAITYSPREQPKTPFIEELPALVHMHKNNVSPRLSVVDHTLRNATDEIQDSNNVEAENSDGSRTSTEERCRKGALISGSLPSNQYVRITEKKTRREPERPSGSHEKPNVKRSLILMGLFAGVAILVGKIFTSHSH